MSSMQRSSEPQATSGSSIGQYLIRRLQDYGLRDVFGIPGDYVLTFYSMLEESPINVVGCTREDCAGYAADAYARLNGLDNIEMHVADLSADQRHVAWAGGGYNKVLLDPPRSGAVGVLDVLGNIHPQRLVYVSCHPGSLARDAGILVSTYGYRLRAAGVMDMFPHTAHVESIALFESA